MRKRSESRGYADENIRDSIVLGDLSSKFPDLGKLQTRAEVESIKKIFLKGLSFASLVKEGFYSGGPGQVNCR